MNLVDPLWAIPAAIYAGYLSYIFAMGVYRAWLAKRLGGLHCILLLPVVVVLIAADVLANAVVGTLVFVDLPRQWLLSTRLALYHSEPQYGWRYALAGWICDHVLDPFDPTGDHC